MKNKLCCLSIVLLMFLLFSACTPVSPAPIESAEQILPEWFYMPLIDAKNGETFTINDFKGKVILVETMAIWCPNCLVQANEVRKLHTLLDDDDLISVTLDVDINEKTEDLKSYVEEFGFDWYFAVAYLDVARALGNLYGANYLNPPLSPMLLIDRTGEGHKLEFGHKKAEELLSFVQPFLDANIPD